MSKLPLESVYKLSPVYRMQWEPSQDCDVLLYPEGMVTLNTSAAEILKHLDGSRDLQTVIRDLETKFDATGLAEDVLEFVVSARDQGWIVSVQSD